MYRSGFATILILSVIAVSVAGFFLFSTPGIVKIEPPGPKIAEGNAAAEQGLQGQPEAQQPSSSPAAPVPAKTPPQARLSNPPDLVKALYLTGWTAGSSSRLNRLIKFAEANGLNGMVIDVKDYSGYVSYAMDAADTRDSGAEKELRIADMNAVLKLLHEHNIYAIARVSVFQDPIFAKAHPEWALARSDTGKLWTDRKGLAWMDASVQEVWAYNAAIARDAFSRGFDEVNFDYIRFPSDGAMSLISYPNYDGKTAKHLVIRGFFKYLREQFPDKPISADLFGLATSASDDLGIGQKIEDAYAYFDYVSPMVYPSHYAKGTLNYANPAAHPYEIISFAMENGLRKWNAMAKIASASTSTAALAPRAKLRPWLQVFDMGADYTTAMINKQLQAVEDTLHTATSTAQYAGWLLWDPKNAYDNFKGT